MDLYENAVAYLANHPGAGRFSSLAEASQRGVLELAGYDIACYLGVTEPDASDDETVRAVCEQALWILVRAARPDANLASEQITGVGERTYFAPENGRSNFLAERAMHILEPKLRRAMGRMTRG